MAERLQDPTVRDVLAGRAGPQVGGVPVGPGRRVFENRLPDLEDRIAQGLEALGVPAQRAARTAVPMGHIGTLINPVEVVPMAIKQFREGRNTEAVFTALTALPVIGGPVRKGHRMVVDAFNKNRDGGFGVTARLIDDSNATVLVFTGRLSETKRAFTDMNIQPVLPQKVAERLDKAGTPVGNAILHATGADIFVSGKRYKAGNALGAGLLPKDVGGTTGTSGATRIFQQVIESPQLKKVEFMQGHRVTGATEKSLIKNQKRIDRLEATLDVRSIGDDIPKRARQTERLAALYEKRKDIINAQVYTFDAKRVERLRKRSRDVPVTLPSQSLGALFPEAKSELTRKAFDLGRKGKQLVRKVRRKLTAKGRAEEATVDGIIGNIENATGKSQMQKLHRDSGFTAMGGAFGARTPNASRTEEALSNVEEIVERFTDSRRSLSSPEKSAFLLNEMALLGRTDTLSRDALFAMDRAEENVIRKVAEIGIDSVELLRRDPRLHSLINSVLNRTGEAGRFLKPGGNLSKGAARSLKKRIEDQIDMSSDPVAERVAGFLNALQ